MTTADTKTSNGFIPPYSEEAEQACIGGVIVDSQPLAIVTKFLNPDKFFILRHRYIWEAIDYLYKRGETIDYLTLTQRLKETNKLSEIGGMVYLTQLINAAPNTTNTESYAQLVERAAIRRQGLAAADEIKKHFMDEKIAVEQVLENAQSVLTAVKPPMSRTKPASMKEVMSNLFDQFDYRIEKGIHQLGIPTGFKQFDTILGGWRKNRLYVVGGRPGMGKTGLMLECGIRVANSCNPQTQKPYKVLLDSMELL
jgi:replicative DNA helicase